MQSHSTTNALNTLAEEEVLLAVPVGWQAVEARVDDVRRFPVQVAPGVVGLWG